MGDKTGIQWTDATWNPLRGCTRVSKGCENCYAETVAYRFSGHGEPYEGLIAIGKKGPRWNGTIKLVPEKLDEPIRWTKSRMIFVNSMSDLFHHRVSNEYIAAVFGVMASAPKHTFQVLTKRPDRAKDWFDWVSTKSPSPAEYCANEAYKLTNRKETKSVNKTWPLSNVWLGVSCEDQDTADKRIPVLLSCNAKIKWVSYEPALGPVDFRKWTNQVDWIVVGGESGSGARAFDWLWADDVVKCTTGTTTKVFVKQLGSNPILTGLAVTKLKNHKGGDPAEWPKNIQIRDYPV